MSRPQGQAIVTGSWVSNVVLAAAAALSLAQIDAAEGASMLVSLVLFGVGVLVWCYAFAKGIARSVRDEVTVVGLFFLSGSAPRPVRVELLGSVLVAVVIAAVTASTEPFAVMEPVLPLALAGAWGARYGRFAPRRVAGRDS